MIHAHIHIDVPQDKDLSIVSGLVHLLYKDTIVTGLEHLLCEDTIVSGPVKLLCKAPQSVV